MATTPPPPSARRIHTPPTPRHGSKYDNYEPYSPRRSSRVAGQRKNYSLSQVPTTSPTSRKEHGRFDRAVTPPTFAGSQTLSAGSQTFSPPASPNSPKLFSSSPMKRKLGNGTGKAKQAHFAQNMMGSDSEVGESSDPFSVTVRGALPTPAKTPRKKALQTQAALSSTARVLFNDRPATIEDAMPTPRKRGRGKKMAFTLSSFEDAGDEDGNAKISIYTDSKERVPSVGDPNENPFLSTESTGRRTRAKVTRTRKKTAEEEHMDDCVANDEGLVYVFRGKKVFRKFSDAGSDDEIQIGESATALHQSGASRRMTRSSIKPRLLFPNESQRRAREAAENAADEEALTDIDPMQASRDAYSNGIEEPSQVRTPAKSRSIASTPPPSGRSGRVKARKTSPAAPEEELVAPEPVPYEAPSPQAKSRSQKISPFASWGRTKGPVASSHGTKRDGDALERDGEGSKRTRSGAHVSFP